MKNIFRILLFLAAFLLPLTAFGQGQTNVYLYPQVPTDCNPNGTNSPLIIFKLGGTNPGMYQCTALNTWTYTGASSLTNIVAMTAGVGTGGVAANNIVKVEVTSGKVIAMAANTDPVFGIAAATVGAGGSVTVNLIGPATCLAEGAITAGHYLIPGSVTPTSCKDSGQTALTSVTTSAPIVGIATATVASGSICPMSLQGPSLYGLNFTSPSLTTLTVPIIGPPSDSTTALQITKADLATRIMDFDTTNARVGINKTPGAFDLDVNGAANVGGTFSVTGHVTFEGITSTGGTGTGNIVFGTAPVFTTNITTPIVKPASNSTTALQITKADGSTRIMDFDTTNARVGINKTPGAFDLDVNGAVNFASTLAVTGHVTVEGVTSAGATGTTNIVFSNSPTLVTPTLGAATATTLNGNTFTTGTYTLTGTAGKTLTFSNTLTLAGTDSTTMTFPSTSATIARTDAGQTFTGVNTMTAPVFVTSAQVPLVIGGTAAGSSLSLESTSGTGTTDFIRALVGTSGGTEAWRTFDSGGFSVGTTSDPGAGQINALNGFKVNGSQIAFSNLASTWAATQQPFTTWIAQLSQSAGAAPTAQILENTIAGGALTLARSGAGVYTLTSGGTPFTANKTAVLFSNCSSNSNANVGYVHTSTSVITVYSNVSNTPNDSVISDCTIMVRVYP